LLRDARGKPASFCRHLVSCASRCRDADKHARRDAAQRGLLRKHERGRQPGWLRRRACAQQIRARSTMLFRVCNWSLAFSCGLAAVPGSAVGQSGVNIKFCSGIQAHRSAADSAAALLPELSQQVAPGGARNKLNSTGGYMRYLLVIIAAMALLGSADAKTSRSSDCCPGACCKAGACCKK